MKFFCSIIILILFFFHISCNLSPKKRSNVQIFNKDQKYHKQYKQKYDLRYPAQKNNDGEYSLKSAFDEIVNFFANGCKKIENTRDLIIKGDTYNEKLIISTYLPSIDKQDLINQKQKMYNISIDYNENFKYSEDFKLNPLISNIVGGKYYVIYQNFSMGSVERQNTWEGFENQYDSFLFVFSILPFDLYKEFFGKENASISDITSQSDLIIIGSKLIFIKKFNLSLGIDLWNNKIVDLPPCMINDLPLKKNKSL